MEFRSYNAELALANMMFKGLFSNIRIDKTDNNNKTKTIIVNCQFGQRSRIFKNWQNAEKRAMMKLPMIVINRTGYNRAPERLNNINNEVKYEITSKNRKYELLTPIPVDIQYEVSIMSKNYSDIDQIATNFMVFFNSDLYVSCQHPKYEGVQFNNQVVMQDSINEEHQDEIDGSVDDFITTTFSFVFKTFLFGGTTQAKLTKKQVLSSYTQTVLSNIISEISPNEIDKFQEEHPNSSVSATFQQEIETVLTTYVDTDLSDMIYDGFIPTINSIHAGFYVSPNSISSYDDFIKSVDSSKYPYINRDKLVWTIDYNLSGDFPNNVTQILQDYI